MQKESNPCSSFRRSLSTNHKKIRLVPQTLPNCSSFGTNNPPSMRRSAAATHPTKSPLHSGGHVGQEWLPDGRCDLRWAQCENRLLLPNTLRKSMGMLPSALRSTACPPKSHTPTRGNGRSNARRHQRSSLSRRLQLCTMTARRLRRTRRQRVFRSNSPLCSPLLCPTAHNDGRVLTARIGRDDGRDAAHPFSRM